MKVNLNKLLTEASDGEVCKISQLLGGKIDNDKKEVSILVVFEPISEAEKKLTATWREHILKNYPA